MVKQLLAFALFLLFLSCSKDDDDGLPGHRLEHVGQKWAITSMTYTVVDESLSNPADRTKTGTAVNPGHFYFDKGTGTFDILINNKRQEDYFAYSLYGNEISILSITQTGTATKFSQNVITFSGEYLTGSTIHLEGTFASQNTTQQYSFSGTFELTRE